jgi:hypothetical protein
MIDFYTSNLEYLENLILYLSKPQVKNCLISEAVKAKLLLPIVRSPEAFTE